MNADSDGPRLTVRLLLLPLWKLNPAREGEIKGTSDFPKKQFGEIRAKPADYCFITAEFQVGELASKIAELASVDVSAVQVVHVERYFDGSYAVNFPDCKIKRTLTVEEVLACFNTAHASITISSSLAKETGLKDRLQEFTSSSIADHTGKGVASEIDHSAIDRYVSAAEEILPSDTQKTSTLIPAFRRLIEELEGMSADLQQDEPGEIQAVEDLVLETMPKFVYYSNYGNLDSEIYLPHVVENLKRPNLDAKEDAKARTLRVLFRFVTLSPDEVLQLGRDFYSENDEKPTSEELEEITEAKKTRSILLQSAGAKLTASFKSWWKQGDYRFRFEADGDHFRIWVSDDLRPEEVELESRSTGLQWFLSFYLVFLVESELAHANSVLLLDEPGLSLHPLAQRNLSSFFDGLSASNQIIYTTHSPFLVDADRLDRARKVYVTTEGDSVASEDLWFGARHRGCAVGDYAGARSGRARSAGTTAHRPPGRPT